MKNKPYYGCTCWKYKLPANTKGEIRLPVPEGNRKTDESMARYYLRKSLGLKKLPQGTVVWPISDGYV